MIDFEILFFSQIAFYYKKLLPSNHELLREEVKNRILKGNKQFLQNFKNIYIEEK
jgi:hypothetical protein